MAAVVPWRRVDDVVTGSDRSDSFEVRWLLESDRVREALAATPRSALDGRLRLRLPLNVDFERLKADDPAAAARLRERSRARARTGRPGHR
ncbi:MAG: hypothetical protein LH624_13510 [Cryobacterium sp.]|nr:hypothetical protein [Cryobacterium sp.]